MEIQRTYEIPPDKQVYRLYHDSELARSMFENQFYHFKLISQISVPTSSRCFQRLSSPSLRGKIIKILYCSAQYSTCNNKPARYRAALYYKHVWVCAHTQLRDWHAKADSTSPPPHVTRNSGAISRQAFALVDIWAQSPHPTVLGSAFKRSVFSSLDFMHLQSVILHSIVMSQKPQTRTFTPEIVTDVQQSELLSSYSNPRVTRQVLSLWTLTT